MPNNEKRTISIEIHPQSNFIDALLHRLDLKNDAALSRYMDLKPPQISKLRHGKFAVSADFILRLHERSDIPVKDIRKMLDKAFA